MRRDRPGVDERGRALLEQGSPQTALILGWVGVMAFATAAVGFAIASVVSGETGLLVWAAIGAILTFASTSTIRTARRTREWDRRHFGE